MYFYFLCWILIGALTLVNSCPVSGNGGILGGPSHIGVAAAWATHINAADSYFTGFDWQEFEVENDLQEYSLQQMQDYFAVNQLIANFAHYLDERDSADVYDNIFCGDDGEIRAVGQLFTGRDRVIAFLDDFMGNFAGNGGLRHMVSNVAIVNQEDDRITTKSTLMISLGQYAGGTSDFNTFFQGAWMDTYSKNDDGQWCLKVKTFVTDDMCGLAGELFGQGPCA